jgi:hypothetical protein
MRYQLTGNKYYKLIYRIIVDILDYNGFNFEKLSLKDDNQSKGDKLLYINSAYEKLKSLENSFNSSYNVIRDNILHFMTVKNNCIGEISHHFDKIINHIVDRKDETIYHLEKFSKDKLGMYNDTLKVIDRYRQIVQGSLDKLDIIKNQKIASKIPIADELSIINDLAIDKLEDQSLFKEIEIILNEMKGDFVPKMIIKNECNLLLLYNNIYFCS